MKLLGGDEGAIRRDGREGDLDRGIVDALDDVRHREPGRCAEGDTQPHDLDELKDTGRDADPTAANGRIHYREEHDRCPVVDQALAFDEQGQPLGRTEALEEGHDGDGIRGRDDRGEHERMRPPETAPHVGDARSRDEESGRRGDGHDDARHGQCQDRPRVLSELGQLEVIGGLEEQARKEDGIEQVLGQVHALDEPRCAQPESRQDEGHGVRDLDAPRGDGHRGGGREQKDQRHLRVHCADTLADLADAPLRNQERRRDRVCLEVRVTNFVTPTLDGERRVAGRGLGLVTSSASRGRHAIRLWTSPARERSRPRTIECERTH